jgi:uncharacterized coiled-coil protein SlyX
METIKKLIDCPMGDEQKMEIGNRIATLEIEIEEVEARKKSAVASFNADITEKQATCLQLSKQLKLGISQEEIECFYALNEPKTGQKQLYRFDNSEKIGEPEKMSEFDGQEKLEFPNELENKVFDAIKEQGERIIDGGNNFIELSHAELEDLLSENLDSEEIGNLLSDGLENEFPSPSENHSILIEQSDYPKLRAILRDTLNPVLANSDKEENIINIPEEKE